MGGLRNIKPPTFDGEVKHGEEEETWLVGILKFFKLHNYASTMEARITMYHFRGSASLWWEHLVKIKYIDEEYITWKKF